MPHTKAKPVPEPAATERITTRSGVVLLVEKRGDERRIELSLRAQTPRKCVLHWGLRRGNQPDWQALPAALWPEGTTAAGANAMQTSFKKQNGEGRIAIALAPGAEGAALEFVLFFPDEGNWDNNGRRNYQIAVAAPAPPGPGPTGLLETEIGGAEVLFHRVFEAEGAGGLAVAVVKADGRCRVLFYSDMPEPLALHWGMARRSPHEWLLPPESLRPPGTLLWQGHTAQTPFAEANGARRLALEFPEGEAPLGIQFVLKQGPDGRWLKQRGGNFYVPIHTPPQAAPLFQAGEQAELSGRIIQAETGPGSWTLMHRFNLCYDLLDQVQGNNDGLALLYVWLRFSGIRQLTWQRNYNTKPRELAHAQERLTHKLADCYRTQPDGRPLVRLMLATVGRGGDGQRIRDEILQIMHRHHVKEVSGHFTEEWHQKLHNNTTPDDIVICEANLEFLRSNGNLDRFYQTLREGGVTRERLESFERPIRTNPDFVPHLKDALIHDFENFLKVLKAVHSGTDLETAMNTAWNSLDPDTQSRLREVWSRRNDPPDALASLVEQITEVRRRLSRLLHEGQALRALLYLDLALEQLVRVVVERNLHQHLSGDQLTDLTGCVLENVTLSFEDPELASCLRHWARLRSLPRFGAAWSLHASSVVDRVGRALGDWTDRLYRLLQPKAEFLGQAFSAESWTITLFSEEVVRGSSLGFALAMLLHQLGRVLRQAANLGAWRIVSRGSGTGQVEVVEALRSVQGRRFGGRTVVVADKVMGDEEIPAEVVAVIAPDVTDLVSHVAVRARNAGVLFASCSEPETLQRLKALQGHPVRVTVTAAGDVVFEETVPETGAPAAPARRARPKISRPKFTRFAVAAGEFNSSLVGGKSLRQEQLRGKLPDWIRQPASAAVPFGVFEHVLSLEENGRSARRYAELTAGLKNGADPAALAAVREAVQSLAAPDSLKKALREASSQAGLPWPGNWDAAWRCVKQVWASKWNERAVLSRNRIGLAHEDLVMAVLIQTVVEADYAFVIHTANPSTGNRDELYAEVVLGLGETLVGNYPGRALGFVWEKKSGQLRLLSFPGKSVGLYGGGLIFRSDSNGEDLEGYAGAGLYDSVLLQPARPVQLDYSEEPLNWDEGFRANLLASIARLGLAIEAALGSPQDIEGAVAKAEYFLVQTRPQV
ncbi:MAG TPA: PEP/pyruvate-binding domain-containing protein [Verrucomicrobiae bacterium]